ncbi:hypothetical protein TWF696_007356 [Orbilia brochopaga]|uniref:Uncharacterized protein n=1 Tax=Orbilia brochopaga TaxID=3140254 RepID=A0AAV9USK7_9PEZI
MGDDKPVDSKLPGFLKDSLIGVLIALGAIALLVLTAVIIPKIVRYRQAQRRRLQDQTDNKDCVREEETVGILNRQRTGLDLDGWERSSDESTEREGDLSCGVQLEALELELPLSSDLQPYLTSGITK